MKRRLLTSGGWKEMREMTIVVNDRTMAEESIPSFVFICHLISTHLRRESELTAR